MSKKHIIGGLIGMGVAAVAGAAVATVKLVKKKHQSLEAPEEAILLDLDGDSAVEEKLGDLEDAPETEAPEEAAEAPEEAPEAE